MAQEIKRRTIMKTLAVTPLVAAGALSSKSAMTIETKNKAQFSYCLNTSTIRGQELSLVEELEIASKAGYTGVEPWVNKINDYAEKGGSLSELRTRISDLGLQVESAIAFAEWIVDDETRRQAGLDTMRRDMDVLAQIGGKRIAAAPLGAFRDFLLDLDKAAERYRATLDLGDETGVTPQLELWGPSKLHRLGQAVYIMIEAGHPKACMLPDVYHIYKGGSDFHGLKSISGGAIQVFHCNDYPATPARADIGDGDRIYPGDGIAPMDQILQDLQVKGEPVVLSLELFSKKYWAQDALQVAQTGLAKMKTAVAAAQS
jgi:sugar phosphate isomerase/epimerase